MTKNIVDYGARAGGKKLSTEAIHRAIADVSQDGGGTVLVPAGTFLTGRVELLSNVTLYLESGATLLGSQSLNDYEGSGAGDHERHLIFARNTEAVGIAGPGRIDGQGPSFWELSDKLPKPQDQQWAAVASHKLKPKQSGHPSPMIYFMNCRSVRIQDVRLENSPGWTLHAFNCDDVNIQGISIDNPIDGPNTDGIDLTGCQNVTVSNCSIHTGDDAICLKSDNRYGAEPRLVSNVKVTNCSLTTCCNGFKVGTSSEGGVENIAFSNSVVYSPDVPDPERVISGVALEVIDGGWIDGVEVTGIQMQRTRSPIFIRLGSRKSPQDPLHQGLRNVSFTDIHATDVLMPSCISGLPGMEVQNVTFTNLHTSNVLASRAEWVGRSIPEKPSAYPEVWMFGMLPASGMYARHVRGLHLSGVDFSAPAGEARPALILDDVSNAEIARLSSTPVNGSMPVVQLIGCRDVQILNSASPRGTKVYLEVAGSNSSGIALSGDDLSGARKAFETSDGAAPGAVTWSGENAVPK
ncbi:MAG TPA: glycosyl hydrolase family 28 protein [Terracidiphilus sp.]|jgi:hypothetical protein|nr:glycosyl hydrolase family 28 protein [Terracidiphilus sp.]